MPFHSLNTDSGGSDEDRRNEATRILTMFQDFNVLGHLSKKEREFVDKMAQGFAVSVNQLFWLREIKTRILE